MKITSKAQFFRLWKAGVLGNRTNLWERPEDAVASRAPLIGFREIGKSGGGSWTRVSRDQVYETAQQWRRLGRKFICDDGAPDESRVLQGEICRTIRGLEGFLDVGGRLPMRQAIAAGHMRPCTGATILALLDKFMDPSSRDDLFDLLDLYPDATIEFSCFTVDVGVFPNRATMFWEVRNYIWFFILIGTGFLF